MNADIFKKANIRHLKKCYSSISQEIADMCFIALARVYIDYCNENFANLNRNKASSNKNQISPTHQQNAATSHQSFDNSYLSMFFLQFFKSLSILVF